METEKQITTEDVLAFMKARVLELSAQVPGYVTLEIEAKEGLGSSIHFRAYSEHVGHSRESNDPFAAIEELAKLSEGKSEAELLRDKAAKLLNQAEALEAKGAAA